jgi:hypothetical protein
MRADSVEVAVCDGDGATVPKSYEPASSSLGGRGLGIVARLSLRWGVLVGDDRAEKKVWAEVPLLNSTAELAIVSARDA